MIKVIQSIVKEETAGPFGETCNIEYLCTEVTVFGLLLFRRKVLADPALR